MDKPISDIGIPNRRGRRSHTAALSRDSPLAREAHPRDFGCNRFRPRSCDRPPLPPRNEFASRSPLRGRCAKDRSSQADSVAILPRWPRRSSESTMSTIVRPDPVSSFDEIKAAVADMLDGAGCKKLLREIGDIGAIGSTRDKAKWCRIRPTSHTCNRHKCRCRSPTQPVEGDRATEPSIGADLAAIPVEFSAYHDRYRAALADERAWARALRNVEPPQSLLRSPRAPRVSMPISSDAVPQDESHRAEPAGNQ
jgi:hypothetical protein